MIIISYGIFHVLSKSGNIFENVIQKYHSYNVRPLAFVSDAYVFQWFGGNLYVLLVLMLVMHALNIFFICQIAKRLGVRLGTLFVVFTALSPLLIEGLYWISASTRIVVSMCLSLASLYLLLLSFEEEPKSAEGVRNNKGWHTKKIVLIAGAIVLNLICVGYYEQTIALNLFLFAFVLILLKKYWYILVPILSTTWIGAWYVYFMMHGEMQERGALSLGIRTVLSRLGQALDDVKVLFHRSIGEYLVALGRGTNTAMLRPVLLVFVLLVLSVVFFYICKNHLVESKELQGENKNEKKEKVSQKQNSQSRKIFGRYLKKFSLGILMIVAPMLPFAVLASSYTAKRNLYLPFFGIAIVIELLLELVLSLVKNENIRRNMKECVVGFLLITFVLANVDGLDNYHKIGTLDNQIAASFLKALPDEAFEPGKVLVIHYDSDELQKAKDVSSLVECSLEADWLFAGKIEVAREKAGSFSEVYINPAEDMSADYEVYVSFLPELTLEVESYLKRVCLDAHLCIPLRQAFSRTYGCQ